MELTLENRLSASLAVEQGISGSLSTQQTLNAEISLGGSACPVYQGPYEIAPSSEAQTLQTSGQRMTEDVVVGAIPNNYGLITWNGSFLTVS